MYGVAQFWSSGGPRTFHYATSASDLLILWNSTSVSPDKWFFSQQTWWFFKIFLSRPPPLFLWSLLFFKRLLCRSWRGIRVGKVYPHLFKKKKVGGKKKHVNWIQFIHDNYCVQFVTPDYLHLPVGLLGWGDGLEPEKHSLFPVLPEPHTPHLHGTCFCALLCSCCFPTVVMWFSSS